MMLLMLLVLVSHGRSDIKKCRLAGAYPENSVGGGELRKKCHSCYTKMMGPKGTNYKKYLLITHFELH